MNEIERKKLMIECDMLEGNINRMMITDNFEELEGMFIVAVHRLVTIYDKNKQRIANKMREEINERN